MPYPTVASLPDHVKKLPEKKQRQWMHIWNSVYERTGDEGRAFAAANAILHEKNYEDSEIEIMVKNAVEGDTVQKKDEAVTTEFKLRAKDIKAVTVTETDSGLLLKGVPVFKAGKYGSQQYDEKFIDEKIIGQFDADEDVPFQADHSDSSRDTLGYIRGLTRDKDFLNADIELRDDNAITRWKKGLLKKFSIGFYTVSGKLREISAVAFPRVKEAVVHSEEPEDDTKMACPGCNDSISKDSDKCSKCGHEFKKAGDNEMAEEKGKEATELLKEAAETQAKLEAERDGLKTQLTEKDKEIVALKETIKKAKISELVTSLKADGKILPAMEAKTVEFMATLDEAGIEKFVAVLKESKAAVDLSEKGAQKSEKTEEKKCFADTHSAEECVQEAERLAKENKTNYKEEYDKLFVVV